MLRRRAWWATLTLPFIGCSYPAFSFSSDGSSEGDAILVADSSADVAEGAAPEQETSIADAVASDTTPDDSSVADASPDAKTDAGPTLAGACMGSHAFCVDFDGTATSSPFGFDTVGASGTGTYEVNTLSSATSPRSFACAVGASTSAPAYAFAVRKLDGPSSSALTRIDADLYLTANSYGTNANIFKIQRWGDGHGVGLSLVTSGAALQVNGTSNTWIPVPVPLPVGRWFHVRLEARLRITAGSYALYVDDMTTPVMSATDVSTVDMEGTQRELFNGIWVYDLPLADLRVLYDDVSVDFLP